MKNCFLLLSAVWCCGSSAFVPRSALRLPPQGTSVRRHAVLEESIIAEPLTTLGEEECSTRIDSSWRRTPVAAVASTLVALTFLPDAALAVNTDVIPNALIAYGHYFFLLAVMGLLTFERATVKPGMSPETEKSLVIADASYGVTAALLFATGYFRAVEYGKGWEFYAHEPLFWLKLSFGGLLAGLSLFPTITLVKRGSKIFKDEAIEPMSEKLASRMQQILTAEISAILSIPLIATLMARGVSYNDGFPWQAGAALTGVTLVGSSVLYAKQALTWTEDDDAPASIPSSEAEQ